MNTTIEKINQRASAAAKRLAHILTVGSVADAELVRHTYVTDKRREELGKLVSNYLDDCGCDYDESEVDDIVDGLRDEDFAKFGNHFFRLTEPENIR